MTRHDPATCCGLEHIGDLIAEHGPDTQSKEHPMTDPTNDPMPVFTLKAKDRLAAQTIQAYIAACEVAGLHWQADQCREALAEFEGWQARHPDAMKLPDHLHVPVSVA